MNIELVHIDDCPNWESAGRLLRTALDGTGHEDETITFTVVTTPEEATRASFAGSPTILIDGVDAFPSEGATSDLACRVYSTPKGLAGSPTLAQLVEVLEQRG